MHGQVYVDGQYVDAGSAGINVFDQAFLCGDGVFEDIRVYGGRPFTIERQIERLEKHVALAKLSIPLGRESLVNVAHQLIRRNHILDGGIRIILTRGSGDLCDSHEAIENEGGGGTTNGDARKMFSATTIMLTAGLDMFSRELPRSGIEVTVYGAGKDEKPIQPSKVKWLRQIDRVAAFRKVDRAGFLEAITVDRDGWVTGALDHIVFVIRSQELLTPDMSNCYLGDTFREVIVDLAKNIGLRVIEAKLSVDDLLHADECFLSGFVTEFVPILAINGVARGPNEPGKMMHILKTHFDGITRDLLGSGS